MTKILLVDDIAENIAVLEMLIEEYMEDNEIEDYTLLSTINSTEGIKIAKDENIDIIFLDIMMPKLDGFGFLKCMRNYKQIEKQPIIIMTTALGDDATKKQEQKYGANAYMVKPISLKILTIMLDKYIPQIISASQDNDFDDLDDFDDFDDLNDTQIDENLSELDKITRKSYDHVKASDFMQEYEFNTEAIVADLEDLDILIYDVFESVDDDIDLELQIENIIKIFTSYQEFLAKFTELYDLYVVIEFLANKLQALDLSILNEKQKQNISKFIRSIVFDLIEFKDQVFVKQKANNIFYINASIASSCIQIEYILEH